MSTTIDTIRREAIERAGSPPNRVASIYEAAVELEADGEPRYSLDDVHDGRPSDAG